MTTSQSEEKRFFNGHKCLSIQNVVCQIFQFLDFTCLLTSSKINKQWFNDSKQPLSIYHLNIDTIISKLTRCKDYPQKCLSKSRFCQVQSVKWHRPSTNNQNVSKFFDDHLQSLCKIQTIELGIQDRCHSQSKRRIKIFNLLSQNMCHLKSIKLFARLNSKMWIWSCMTGSGTHAIDVVKKEWSQEEEDCLSKSYVFPQLQELVVGGGNLCHFLAPESFNKLKSLKLICCNMNNNFWKDLMNHINKLGNIQQLLFNNCRACEKDRQLVIDVCARILRDNCRLKKLEIFDQQLPSMQPPNTCSLTILTYHIIKDLIEYINQKKMSENNDNFKPEDPDALLDCQMVVSNIVSRNDIKLGRLKLKSLNKPILGRLESIEVDLMKNKNNNNNHNNNKDISISNLFKLIGNHIEQVKCCIDSDKSAFWTVKDFLDIISTEECSCESVDNFNCNDVKSASNKNAHELENDETKWSSKFSFGSSKVDSDNNNDNPVEFEWSSDNENDNKKNNHKLFSFESMFNGANNNSNFTFDWSSNTNCNDNDDELENKIDNEQVTKEKFIRRQVGIVKWRDKLKTKKIVTQPWFAPDNNNNNNNNNTNSTSSLWQSDSKYKRKSRIKRLILNGCDKMTSSFTFSLFDQIEFENQCLQYIKIYKMQPILEKIGVHLTQTQVIKDFWQKIFQFLKENNYPCCDITLTWAISYLQTNNCVNLLSQLIYQLYNDFNYDYNYNNNNNNSNNQRNGLYQFSFMIVIHTNCGSGHGYTNGYFSFDCSWIQQLLKQIETINDDNDELMLDINPNTKRMRLAKNSYVQVFCGDQSVIFGRNPSNGDTARALKVDLTMEKSIC